MARNSQENLYCVLVCNHNQDSSLYSIKAILLASQLLASDSLAQMPNMPHRQTPEVHGQEYGVR